MATEAKLLPRWGTPHRIVDQVWNSYRLETIQGLPIAGLVSACRLRRFTPRPGTLLVEEQMWLEFGRVAELDVPMESVTFNEDVADEEEGEVDDVMLE